MSEVGLQRIAKTEASGLLTHVEEARRQAFGEIEQRLIVLYKDAWIRHAEQPAAAGEQIDLRYINGILDALHAVGEVTGLTHDDIRTTLAVLDA